MGMRQAGPMCIDPLDPIHPWPTPGFCGINDAATPGFWPTPPASTPGAGGANDAAAATANAASAKVEAAAGKGTSGLDIDAAIKKLDENALDKSKGRCSYYVAVAINAGLPADKPKLTVIDAKELGPANGGKMGPVLTKIGFIEVDAKDYKPQKGDVAVTPAYEGYSATGDGPGHVCMYDGTQWVSDFTQGNNAKGYGAKYSAKDEERGALPAGKKAGDLRVYPSPTRYYRP